jgi:hypothetical protein
MAYEYLTVGSQRFTVQGYLTPTNPDYAFRIYHVSVVGSSTGAIMDICQVTAGTTATSATTKYISVALNNSGTNFYSAEWDVHYGRLFDGGVVLVHTCTGFSYAIVDYTILKK